MESCSGGFKDKRLCTKVKIPGAKVGCMLCGCKLETAEHLSQNVQGSLMYETFESILCLG